jgi:hypothetical protein
VNLKRALFGISTVSLKKNDLANNTFQTILIDFSKEKIKLLFSIVWFRKILDINKLFLELCEQFIFSNGGVSLNIFDELLLYLSYFSQLIERF